MALMRDEAEELANSWTDGFIDGADLTDWEIHFTESIADKLDDPNWEPTERQLEKIEQILEKIG